MKEVLKENIFVILEVIGLIFLMIVYFVGLNQEGDIFASLGSGVGPIMQESYIVDLSSDIEDTVARDIPTLYYNGGTRSVGESVYLKELFDVLYEDGTIVPLNEVDTLEITLKDIRDTENNLVLEKLSTEDIEALEEIPAAFIYDNEQFLLYLHKSGVFTVYINIYSGTGNGALYQFSIPVEVG